MTLWDWVSSKNIELMRVAGEPGVGDAIMGLRRGATVWARLRGVEVSELDVDRSFWTASSDLVGDAIQKNAPMWVVTAEEQLATEDEAKAKVAEEQRRERFTREGRAHDQEAIVTQATARDGNVQIQTIRTATG